MRQVSVPITPSPSNRCWRIWEVLRGPATLLYGGGAIGGVVNVIDNRVPRTMPESLKGAIEYRHDSVDDGDTTVAKFDGAAGSVAWHLDGVYRDWSNVDIPGSAFNKSVMDTQFSSDQYIANTDGRNHTVTAGASWINDDGYLGFSISDMKNNYGIPLEEVRRRPQCGSSYRYATAALRRCG